MMDNPGQFLMWMAVLIVPAWLILMLNDRLKARANPPPPTQPREKMTWRSVGIMAWVGLVFGTMCLLAMLPKRFVGVHQFLHTWTIPGMGLMFASLVLWIGLKIVRLRFRWRRVHALLLLANHGDMPGALHDAQEWSQHKPHEPMAWVAVATLHWQRQDWVAAEEAVSRYDALLPNGTDLLVLKPTVIAKQGRMAEADALYRAALAKQPQEIRLLISHCRLLLDLGSPQEAQQQYEAARQRREKMIVLGRAHRDQLDKELAECGALVAASQGQGSQRL